MPGKPGKKYGDMLSQMKQAKRPEKRKRSAESLRPAAFGTAKPGMAPGASKPQGLMGGLPEDPAKGRGFVPPNANLGGRLPVGNLNFGSPNMAARGQRKPAMGGNKQAAMLALLQQLKPRR
jgi:hypothetical protein